MKLRIYVSLLIIILVFGGVHQVLAYSGEFRPTQDIEDQVVYGYPGGLYFGDDLISVIGRDDRNTYSGIIFRNLNITEGSYINNATLLMYYPSGRVWDESGDVSVQIRGVEADNPQAFSYDSLVNPPLTNSYSLFNASVMNSTGWYSVDVTQQVQEIVDNYFWDSGDELALRMFELAPTTPGESYNYWFEIASNIGYYKQYRPILNITWGLDPSGIEGVFLEHYCGYDIYESVNSTLLTATDPVNLTPSVSDDDTLTLSTDMVFMDDNYYYVMFFDNGDFAWWYSSDGSSWTEQRVWNSSVDANSGYEWYSHAVDYSRNEGDVVFNWYNGDPTLARRGSVDGSITLEGVEMTVIDIVSNKPMRQMALIDTDGKEWHAQNGVASPFDYSRLVRNVDTDGTFTQDWIDSLPTNREGLYYCEIDGYDAVFVQPADTGNVDARIYEYDGTLDTTDIYGGNAYDTGQDALHRMVADCISVDGKVYFGFHETNVDTEHKLIVYDYVTDTVEYEIEMADYGDSTLGYLTRLSYADPYLYYFFEIDRGSGEEVMVTRTELSSLTDTSTWYGLNGTSNIALGGTSDKYASQVLDDGDWFKVQEKAYRGYIPFLYYDSSLGGWYWKTIGDKVPVGYTVFYNGTIYSDDCISNAVSEWEGVNNTRLLIEIKKCLDKVCVNPFNPTPGDWSNDTLLDLRRTRQGYLFIGLSMIIIPWLYIADTKRWGVLPLVIFLNIFGIALMYGVRYVV